MTITACSELGRSTRCYVSAYQRDRIHNSNLARGEVRFLVADFNGAIPAGRSIASATWRCYQGFPVAMSSPTISGRETTVQISAQCMGQSFLKCEATMDNGETLTQRFQVNVSGSWWGWFDSEPVPVIGPTVLTVSV